MVGAGLAGLAAARGLQRLGHKAVVFEARGRVGGRVERTPVGDGWFEGGAEWVDADHPRVLGLAEELGAQLLPTLEREDWFVGPGFRRRASEWPELAAAESAMAQAALRPVQGTVADVIAEVSADPAVRWALAARCRSDEGLDAEAMDAAAWARGQAVYSGRAEGAMSAFRLADGCARLAHGLAAVLADVRLGCPVNAVVPDGGGVAVESAWGAESFDRAVVALPLPQARRIARRAGWPEPGGSLAPAVKLGLAFSREFWRDHGWGGSMLSASVAQQVWRAACDAPVLVTYVCGAAASDLSADAMGAAQHVLEALEEAWPGALCAWTDARVCDWAGDKWAEGGFSAPGPGPAYRPHPRVHFVGEPFAEWYGFMEGALESVERLLEEVANDGVDPR